MHLDRGGGYMTVFICQKSLNCTVYLKGVIAVRKRYCIQLIFLKEIYSMGPV